MENNMECEETAAKPPLLPTSAIFLLLLFLAELDILGLKHALRLVIFKFFRYSTTKSLKGMNNRFFTKISLSQNDPKISNSGRNSKKWLFSVVPPSLL